jgi:uncharacterized protein with PIN domain
MAVPCPGCGREYDVTLFEFGRTLWCTCGRRVGLEARARSQGAPAPERFIADAMLGRLARWLRLLGFDCAYDSQIADAELVRRGVVERRSVLTRDRALCEEWRVPEIHLVRAETTREQLLEVLRRFGLVRRIRLFSRCAECNVPLEPADAAQVSQRIPQRVRETHDSFSLCPGCGRVYWAGSHTRRIQRVVDGLLGQLEAP